MKYLKLYQSHLKADFKYSYKYHNNQNQKHEFNKYYAIHTHDIYNEYEDTYQSLFLKYMNNDIYIMWDMES